MTLVKLILDVKDSVYIAANPTKILSLNEPIYRNDGFVAYGDGATQLSSLVFKPLFTIQTGKISGGVVSVGSYGGSGTNNDIRVTASDYYILGLGVFSSPQTDFLDISLSSSGTQRYIGLYGTGSSTVIKVEGSEAALATFPDTPVDTCLIGYVLVTDAVASGTVDLSGYLLKSSKSTPGSVNDITDDDHYITPFALSGFRPRKSVSVITTSSTPTINCDTTDELDITALASDAVFAAPTGTPRDGDKILYRYKDNGTSRAISLNSIFVDLVGIPPNTTIGKVGMFGARWAASRSKWEIIATVTEP
jgi:hypothetical protein